MSKIIMINGDTLKVNMQSISDVFVTFNYPNAKESQYINRKIVKQIIYSNGDTVIVTTPIVISGEGDWEKVVLTTNPNNVSGLNNLGEIQGKGRSLFGSKKRKTLKAEKDIKIQAAKKSAFIIFVKSQTSFKITGTAYSY
ncbi:MAG: hypothetical protein V1904_08290 [Bacteroidota bacterium]